MSELTESQRRAVARRAEIEAGSGPDETTIAPAPNPGPFNQGHHDSPLDNERHLAAVRRQAADLGLRTTGTTKEPVRINSALNYPTRRG